MKSLKEGNQVRQEPVEEGAMSNTAPAASGTAAPAGATGTGPGARGAGPGARGAGPGARGAGPIDPLEQRRIDDALATMVAARFEPFSFVEQGGFRDFTKLMNPNYVLPSKKKLSSEIMPDLYRRTREKVKERVDKAKAVCLSLSRTTTVYMSLTCHFIDEDFQMVSCLLDCFVMSEECIHDELAEELLRVAEDWNIAAKVVACVSDDTDDIVKAIGTTGWPHLPCFAHTLNLIANNGLAAVQPTVDMVKAIVKYVHDNNVAADKLEATQEQLGVPEPMRLMQDCPTGWNPVYCMLSWVLAHREAVICTLDFVDHGLPTPSAEEWEDVQLACDILKPFDQVRVQMSEQCYDSASYMYVVRRSLQNLTVDKQRAGNLSDPVKKMVDTMVQEMATRFHNMEHHLLREAAALDPRFNKLIQHQDEEADRTSEHLSEVPCRHQQAAEEEGEVREENPTRYNRYVEMLEDCSALTHSRRTRNPTTDAIMSEVGAFVEEETRLDFQSDPLAWWKARCRLYPRLCTVMKKRLCIVATSLPSKSLFGNSESEEILEISERLDRINPTKVSQLVFLHVHLQ